MKKEDFLKLGIDEETAKKCETASQEELKGFVPKTRFDEIDKENKELQKTVQERDEQLETLKNSTGDLEAMKKQISDLQADNKAKDEAYAKEIKDLKLNNAIDKALTEAKAKNSKAVRAYMAEFLNTAELAEDGTVKGLAEQIASLQKSDSYLFEAKGKKQIKGAQPGESGNDDGNPEIDFTKMTYTEMEAYLAENPDAKIN